MNVAIVSAKLPTTVVLLKLQCNINLSLVDDSIPSEYNKCFSKTRNFAIKGRQCKFFWPVMESNVLQNEDATKSPEIKIDKTSIKVAVVFAQS